MSITEVAPHPFRRPAGLGAALAALLVLAGLALAPAPPAPAPRDPLAPAVVEDWRGNSASFHVLAE